ncbi:alpha/beta fold hydrolase [Legionella maioricensis]|uniref:Alpha/beta hydrolase n=1 Tax=Legionella maioricensis TaxID=2896528 RepID=A0A9X2D098_9GAMM|nr:alpha/beta hydrolase [Legionella maioricensis]MCL9683987.1 alpha/beta hydrolase [Legionella maioricensis]MCL9687968.1 alpha/beta hydrolase [Legionella maioricensis]
MNYTSYGYRINQITTGSGYNWLFLPGGPGLGSEYLIEFCKKLALPGSILLLDFPRDGTNTQGQLGIKYWQDGLIALLKTYNNPILVTHSFSGMFSLNMPEIESYLSGLVLMNTTTANSFFQHVSVMREKYNLPDLVPAASEYHLNPTNETYKQFWNTYKHYCFTPEEMLKGEQMIPLFAFNNAAYYEAIEHFYPDYSCKWSPRRIPAMTIASEYDFICPPQIFMENKHFQSQNIMNKVVDKAGHCPWIAHFEQVQDFFDEFIITLNPP